MNTAMNNQVLWYMEKFGGSFASALAVAWRHADSNNAEKLYAAFGDLYEKYRAIAETDNKVKS